MTRNLEFLGIFEKCEKLIGFWSKFQAIFIFMIYFFLPAIFLMEKYSFYIFLGACFVIFILGIIGFCRSRDLTRMFYQANEFVSKHPNKDLVKLFNRAPRILIAISLLELFLPIVWIFSFILKFFFYKNFDSIRSMIVRQ